MFEAGLVAHLGEWPMVVPIMHGFTAATLYLHGSFASRSLDTAGAPVCVTINLARAVAVVWLLLLR